ncbi:MAG: XRE family transcriptional regulator [Candidatus Proteinoplasmatales archaeon SG8-5]|nr:MAG: XRE family transcriptional regulator [Candidatus Proteinoplasmatales archaeon SG8-5]
MHQTLKEKIAGEITLSNEAGSTIRKWRNLFAISQKELALTLEVSPSVISDYEAGRRQSPGIATVRKIIDALIDIELARGGENLKRFEDEEDTSAIISIGEFSSAWSVERFIEITDSECLNTESVDMGRQIFGYTIIDSIKAITSYTSNDYMKVYGWSTERALLFSGVHYGRSPMIAVRAHPMKPAIVVYIRPENVDDLAVRLAELEHIVLLRTDVKPDELAKRLEAHR